MGLPDDTAEAIAAYEEAMAQFAFHKALMAVWNLISQMNRYIDVTAPWFWPRKINPQAA